MRCLETGEPPSFHEKIDTCHVTGYNYTIMIVGFRHRGLKKLYERGDGSRLPADMIQKISAVLAALDLAQTVNDLDRPSFRLHPLTGNRAGQWSVTVRSNWRIVFRFENGDASDVDFVDYH